MGIRGWVLSCFEFRRNLRSLKYITIAVIPSAIPQSGITMKTSRKERDATLSPKKKGKVDRASPANPIISTGTAPRRGCSCEGVEFLSDR